jgi:hypothetical protein
MTDDREWLRHCLATLAYRAAKAVRDAPPGFGEFHLDEPTAMTPARILSHMGGLMRWALALADGNPPPPTEDRRASVLTPRTWDNEVERFFAALGSFDAYLASAAPLHVPAERLFQGPIADALTHTGQLATRRRLAGSPVRGENYFVAEITIGRVGVEQTPPVQEGPPVPAQRPPRSGGTAG